MNVKAIIYKVEEGGYWAKVPSLPGVYTQGGTLEDRVARFLEREPLLNFQVASALRHDAARVIGQAECGAALVGVAVASGGTTRDPALVRLDAIGPVALRRLLATLRDRPARMALHRPWFAEVIERELGPLRVRFGYELYATGAVYRAPDPDARVQEIRPAYIQPMLARPHDWLLDVLADHLARGWQAFGILEDGELVTQACCAFPTGGKEEICHVYTARERRGQGLATATVGAALTAVHARGHHAVYFSRTANTASRRVAERCGLRHVASMCEVAPAR